MGIYSNTFNPFDTDTIPQDYLDTCRKIWADTTQNNVAPIFTLKHLSLLSGVDYKLLYSYTSRNVNPYKKIILSKGRKKRHLFVPWKEIAKVQNWIKQNILDNLESSDFSTAYDKKCSIVENAKVHIDSPWMIKLDIKNFFHSIYEKDVYTIFNDLGYTELLSLELARLCTYHKVNKNEFHNIDYGLIKLENQNKPIHRRKTKEDLLEALYINKESSEDLKLPQKEVAENMFDIFDENYSNEDYPYLQSKSFLPQGASTSPKLANLFAKKLDKDIWDMLNTTSINNIKYTRYSDDIVISGDLENMEQCKEIIQITTEILRRHKLKINDKKTKIFSPKAIKKVTGINIIDNELRPSKKILNYIQTSLHYIEEHSLENHINHLKTPYKFDVETYKRHLLGKIHFVKSINNELGTKLLIKYNEVCL